MQRPPHGALGMEQCSYSRLAAASLLVLGFGLLVSVAYADARSDFEPMNVSANLAVLLAVFLAVLLLALARGHEAGAGIAALLTGAVVLDLVLRTQEPRYFLPPLFVFFGGLFALYSYALKVQVEPPVPGPTNDS